MRTYRMIGMALSAIMMCLNLLSCTEEEIIDSAVIEEEKTYEVSLNFGGEYVDITETPLSRADTPKKFYAVNVYCIKADGTEDYYSNYAYGVFDTVEAMKITLLGGYKYKFECTSATEGEDRFVLSDYSLEWPGNKYTDKARMNVFITEDSSFPELEYGYSNCINDLRGYTNAYYPRMDRYYGVLSDYVPTDGGTVTISMKRCAFGVKMVINGVPDGTLSWGNIKTQLWSDWKYLTLTPNSCTGTDKYEFSTLYTFYELGECWEKAVAGEEYSKQMSIKFSWERANGYKQEFSREFTVKRNVMTNLNVTLSGGSGEFSVGLEEEGSEMTDENVIVEYDGGSTSDTEVNPAE